MFSRFKDIERINDVNVEVTQAQVLNSIYAYDHC